MNYADVFLFDLAMKLPKNTGINKQSIPLQEDKQSLYKPIHSLELVKLETLKTYIKTNLKLGLFDLLSFLKIFPFYLIKSQTVSFGCVSIIKVSITL